MQGWCQNLPDGRLVSPTGGLYSGIEYPSAHKNTIGVTFFPAGVDTP